jgi:hypothetical protein
MKSIVQYQLKARKGSVVQISSPLKQSKNGSQEALETQGSVDSHKDCGNKTNGPDKV